MYLLWVVKYIIIIQSNTKCRPPSHNTPTIIILPLVFPLYSRELSIYLSHYYYYHLNRLLLRHPPTIPWWMMISYWWIRWLRWVAKDYRVNGG